MRGALIAAGLALAAIAGVSTMGKSTLGNQYMTGKTWSGLLPKMKTAVYAILAKARAEKLPVMFFNGWRDPQAERGNMANGTSYLSDPYDSEHIWGAAADFCFMDSHGQPFWPPDTDPRWQQLGQIGKSLGLVWGGDWTEKDLGHFQLANVNAAALHSQYGTDYAAWLNANGATV